MSNDEGILTRLSAVERDLAGIAIQVESLNKTVTEFLRTYRTEARTPWGVIFAGFSLSMSVISIIGWLTINPIADSIKRLEARLDELSDHTQDGHPDLIRQLVLTNRNRIEEVEDRHTQTDLIMRDLLEMSVRAQERLKNLEQN